MMPGTPCDKRYKIDSRTKVTMIYAAVVFHLSIYLKMNGATNAIRINTLIIHTKPILGDWSNAYEPSIISVLSGIILKPIAFSAARVMKKKVRNMAIGLYKRIIRFLI